MRDTVLHPAAMRSGAFRHPNFLLGDGRACRNLAVIFFSFLSRHFRRDVAGNHHGHVVRAVISFEPLLHVTQRGCVKIFHRADHRPRIRMADRISVLDDQLFRNAVGLVLPLALFVLHHAALQIELLLVEHAEQMSHAVALGEQGVVQHGGGNVLKIIRAIVVRGAVQVGGANFFHRVDVGVIEVVTAAEHQVFEEMGKPGLAQLFIFRTHVVPGVHGHDRSLVVLVHQHSQPIAEHKPGVSNIWNRDVHTCGSRSRSRVGCGRLRLCRRGDRIADHECRDHECDDHERDNPRQIPHR